MLGLEDFKQLVANAPLFAIDLVVLNEQNQILLGQRKNAPAKGFWFVPGGRVFKNESLENAVKRISQVELGCMLNREALHFLGLFDHFYSDSFFDKQISTHYINATHGIRLAVEQLNLPTEQHKVYRWVDVDDLAQDETVHSFSKIFIDDLKQWLNHD